MLVTLGVCSLQKLIKALHLYVIYTFCVYYTSVKDLKKNLSIVDKTERKALCWGFYCWLSASDESKTFFLLTFLHVVKNNVIVLKTLIFKCFFLLKVSMALGLEELNVNHERKSLTNKS